MASNWYNIDKTASEFVGPDASLTPEGLAAQNDFRQWPTGGYQGLGSVSHAELGLGDTEDQSGYGIEVGRCGEEPGSGGCGVDLQDYGDWHDYSVEVNGERYRAYRCKNCGHAIKPFNILYTRHPERYRKPKRKRRPTRRLNSHVLIRTVEAQMMGPATPGSLSSGTYNNPANSPNNSDLSYDDRIIPWSKIDPLYHDQYDGQIQKRREKSKIVKVKDKTGKDHYIRVRFMGGTDGVTPANTYDTKGLIGQQPRYNPASGKNSNDGFGAWPHNRNDTKGWYQSPDNNTFNSDLRQRVIPWSEYIRDRGTNLLTMTKPY